MKKLSTLIIILLLSKTLIASPLVFRSSKTIDSESYVLIGEFNAKDYKQIRYNLTFNRNMMDGDNLSKGNYNFMKVFAVVGKEEIHISNESEQLDIPPDLIRFYAKGKGKFSVYIWGSK